MESSFEEVERSLRPRGGESDGTRLTDSLTTERRRAELGAALGEC